ncbi:hypothetical protein FE784_33000 [Paenibacillus hemerocallicola]|jgi:hypothetical protein|uniref:DUF1992 domain-containing protein n=1 Tax=Paenibacillus hemerocallicola TaxID=1172614 RepID=A0A5C4T1E7_9BACL|nr:hypothetical protein [Paenibacillus hemerocallicola]TNJ61969.1 hypothetical protein FE784_33000 [Paenibacillus hemerocallicola]
MEASINSREETTAFDPFYLEIKHADDLPQWLKLRHDIRAKLDKLMANKHRSLPADFDAGLRAINERIAAYNNHVPNAYLRKPSLSSDNWLDEYEAWQ